MQRLTIVMTEGGLTSVMSWSRLGVEREIQPRPEKTTSVNAFFQPTASVECAGRSPEREKRDEGLAISVTWFGHFGGNI